MNFISEHLVKAEEEFSLLLKKRRVHLRKIMTVYQPRIDAKQQELLHYMQVLRDQIKRRSEETAIQSVHILGE